MNGSDATTTYGLDLVGHLIVDVTPGKHRLVWRRPGTGLEPAVDSLLAIPENVGVFSAHSKCPCWVTGCFFINSLSPNVDGHIELSFIISLLNHAWFRTSGAGAKPFGGAVARSGVGRTGDQDR